MDSGAPLNNYWRWSNASFTQATTLYCTPMPACLWVLSLHRHRHPPEVPGSTRKHDIRKSKEVETQWSDTYGFDQETKSPHKKSWEEKERNETARCSPDARTGTKTRFLRRDVFSVSSVQPFRQPHLSLANSPVRLHLALPLFPTQLTIKSPYLCYF